MVRRSPWAAQARKERNRVRTQFSNSPFGLKFNTAFRVAAGQISNMPFEEKVAFLRNNAASLASVMKKEAKALKLVNLTKMPRDKMTEAYIGALKKDGVLDYTVFETAKDVISRGKAQREASFENHFKEYLKKRGIPFDKQVFMKSLQAYIQAQKDAIFHGSVKPQIFEKSYLLHMKSARKANLADQKMMNVIVRGAFRGYRLTNNQRRAAKKWLDSTRERYGEDFRKLLRETV